MESANLHQHHQLQQLVGLCSSLATQSGYGVSTINNDWNQSIILNGNAYNTYMNEILPNSTRELGQKNVNLIPSVKTSGVQSIDFHDPRSFSHRSDDVLQLGNIKEDISDHHLLKYGDMTYNTLSTNLENSHLPSTSYINHDQPYVLDIHGGGCMIQPFSSGGQTSTGVPEIQTRQLYSSNAQSCAMFAENVSLEHAQVEESNGDPLNNFKEVGWTSGFKNEVARTKRRSGFSETKVSHEAAKKSRFMSQSSCLPPLKVRKEKLGDRIAALHRLVSPFGKTDTASVLTEALGYIQFLQDQIQTLTVPYMKSSFNDHSQRIQMNSKMEDGNEELKRDLRSRGLCLMPLSFTSYISACNRSSI